MYYRVKYEFIAFHSMSAQDTLPTLAVYQLFFNTRSGKVSHMLVKSLATEIINQRDHVRYICHGKIICCIMLAEKIRHCAKRWFQQFFFQRWSHPWLAGKRLSVACVQIQDIVFDIYSSMMRSRQFLFDLFSFVLKLPNIHVCFKNSMETFLEYR